MRETIINKIKEEKLIVILRGISREKLIPLAEAMYEGGVRLLEITYSANGSTPDEETADRIKLLSEHFDGRMFIGAGTVLTEKQVELTANAGGGFIISPDTSEAVIRKTRELGLVSLPGSLTPTEIMNAHRFGADMVKLFPIGNLGVDYLKAVKAPLSHVDILAVGGITLDNIPEYLKAGACGFGISSSIADKKLIDAEDYDGIRVLAQKYVNAAKGL